MRILVSWLREFVTVETGIPELAEMLTARSFEVGAIEEAPAGVSGSYKDAVLDLEITTNRPDCLSVLGIAREVSAIYDAPVTRPGLGGTAGAADNARDDAGESRVSVTIEDAELCPRYAAAVAEVTIGPSPTWLAARLEAADVRPINNVVDVTNYVMLELGHPMHAFDLAKLGGRAIRIRRAAPGETVRTLDAQTRTLADDMLVIADADRPQAIAGVMGGADSEVGAGTRTIVLESAYFKPTSVRNTSKRVGLSTDASYRFERGADIEAPIVALRRALALLAQIGAGEAVGPIVDRYPTPRTPATLELRHKRITQIIGQDIDEGFVPRTLGRLEFDVETLPPVRAGARWRVRVPSHRVDVSREIDLVEEVARHHGYDRLPSTFPALVRAPTPIPRWLRRNRLLNRVLTAAGCWEAITYSFIERSAAEPFVAAPDDIVPIANPLSEKFTVLRPSLLPGLLDSLVWNRRRQHRDIRLFELGNRFRAREGETTAIAVVATGAALAPHWSSGEREVDLFDVKGIVERVCDALGVAAEVEAADYPELVAGRSAVLRALHGDTTLGRLGQIQPAIAAGRGLPNAAEAVYVAELDIAALERVAFDRDAMRATRLPRYPSIVRDIAILVDGALPAHVVRGTIQAAADETLIDVRVFDRYEGKGVPEGQVSLALRLTFRAADRTLTDTEVQATMARVVAGLGETHEAKLR